MPSLKIIIERYLEKRGWHKYYNENAWVNKKCVADPTRQDYTNYAMDLQSAFIHESENLPPFELMLMPEISKKFHKTNNEILEYYFKKQGPGRTP